MTERTEEEIYLRQVTHQAEVVATKLEELAANLRRQADGMAKPGRGGAVGVAADFVNDFTQGVGSIGTFLWGVVRNAQDLDDYRRKTAPQPRRWPLDSPEPTEQRLRVMAELNQVIFRKVTEGAGGKGWLAQVTSGGDGQFYAWREINSSDSDYSGSELVEVLDA